MKNKKPSGQKHEFEQKDFFDYKDMINSWPYENLYLKYVGDYQGDVVLLLKNGDDYGFFTIGYGSCSGCDALEACNTREERVSLALDFKRNIKWRDKVNLINYLKQENLEHEWFWYDEDMRAAINEVIELLE